MLGSPRKIGSVLTLVCVTLTFSLLTLIMGMGEGLLGEFDTAITRMPAGLFEVELRTDEGTARHQFPIEEFENLQHVLRSAQGIAAETWISQFSPYVRLTSTGEWDMESACIMPGRIGVSANYFAVREIEITEGRAFTSLEERSGKAVAVAAVSMEEWPWETWPVQVGSTVPDLVRQPFEVVGICHAGEGTKLYRHHLYVPVLQAYDRDAYCAQYEELRAQGLFEGLGYSARPTPGVTGVKFWVIPKPGQSERLQKELEEALSDYITQDVWLEMKPERLYTTIAHRTRESISDNLLVSSGVVLAVAAINTANLLLLTVMMTSKDIGVKRAVGATRVRIAFGVTADGLRLALTSIGLGLGLAFAGKAVFERVFGEAVLIEAVSTLKVAGLLCGTVLVASIYPAVRAARIQPVEALRGIATRGKRSSFDARKVLLVAAVGVGIAGVLFLTATGYSARRAISMYLAAAGDNWVVVEQHDEFEREGEKPLISLSPELSDALCRGEGAQGGWYNVMTTAFQRPSSSDIHVGSLLVCTSTYMDLKGFGVSRGSMLTPDDDGKPVCVLGADIAARIFGNEEPVGKEIYISDETAYEVVGVLASTPAGHMDLEVDRDKAVLLLPNSASLSKDLAPLVNRRGNIIVVARKRAETKALVASLQSYFETSFPGYEMPKVSEYAEGLSVLSSARDRLDRSYGIIGALALLMAGIGVNNLMMVIVTERTSEIGIRRAVGATRPDVMKLFLGEALRMCLWGTVFGFGTAIPVIVALDKGATLTLGAILRFALTAGAMGVLTGTFGGYYSARSASLKQPVEAVGYE